MRYQSKKQAALYRKHGAERLAFLHEFPWCAVCGRRDGLAVHEILSGTGLRMLAFVSRACWLPACGDCNCNWLTDRKVWPVEKQLALKMELDPLGFDVDEVARIYAPRLFDWAEVMRQLANLRRIERADAA